MTGISLDHAAWVLVADGEKGLILRNLGDRLHPHLEVVRELHQDNPATREQGTYRPGRMSDGPGRHRSAVDDTDWHRIGKEKFAEEIAARLYRMAHRGDYEKLILVAPPLVLGALRKQLHGEVERRVTGELPKTLTNHPLYEIEKILLAA